MENWFSNIGGYVGGGYYGKPEAVSPEYGSGVIVRGLPDDSRAVEQLNDIRRRIFGTQTRGPEAQTLGIDKLYRRRMMYNNWFQTPGMIEAGANMYAGPGTDI
jgi:hypothetical protein